MQRLNSPRTNASAKMATTPRLRKSNAPSFHPVSSFLKTPEHDPKAMRPSSPHVSPRARMHPLVASSANRSGIASRQDLQQCSKEQLLEELLTTQGKLNSVTHTSTVFRQKIAQMMHELAQQSRSATSAQSRSLEYLLKPLKAAASMFDHNTSGGLATSLEGGEEALRDWRSPTQCKEATHRLSEARKAHHLAVTLKERDALLERVKALEDREVQFLSGDKRVVNLLATVDEIRAENVTLSVRVRELEVQHSNETVLQKQLQLSKARLQKLKEELKEQREDAFQQAQELRRSVASLAGEVRTLRDHEAVLNNQIRVLETENERMGHQVLTAKVEAQTAREDCVSLKTRYEQLAARTQERSLAPEDAKRETTSTSSSARGSDANRGEESMQLEALRLELNALQCKYDAKALEAAKLEEEVRMRRSQCHSLEQQVQFLEEQQSDHTQYQTALREVQRHVDGAMDSVRNAQDMTEMVERVQQLEVRLKETQAMEEQIRQQEDTLALKDHEICALRSQLRDLEVSIDSVSRVLVTLPKSVRSLEALTVELNVYREHRDIPAHAHAQVQQEAKLRCVELDAARASAVSALKDSTHVGVGSADGASHTPTPTPLAAAAGKASLLQTTLDVLRRSSNYTQDEVEEEKQRLRLCRGDAPMEPWNTPREGSHHHRPISGDGDWNDSLRSAFQLFDNENTGQVHITDVVFLLQAAGMDHVRHEDVMRALQQQHEGNRAHMGWSDIVLLVARLQQQKQHMAWLRDDATGEDEDHRHPYKQLGKCTPSPLRNGTERVDGANGTPASSAMMLMPSSSKAGWEDAASSAPLPGPFQKSFTMGGGTMDPGFETDVLLTFQLFDENKQGTLDPEQTVLALGTLDTSVQVEPYHVAQRYPRGVTLPDFMSLCRALVRSTS